MIPVKSKKYDFDITVSPNTYAGELEGLGHGPKDLERIRRSRSSNRARLDP